MNAVKSNESTPGVGATLPASWYSTRGIYECERRAIFARRWLLVSHELRFQAPGAYAKFTIAGYPFFIIRDCKGNLNAFLNVCRHRAFPVVLQDSGNASILACKYHGWSYGLNGNLAKAPKFAGLEGFDESQHGLFRVHLKVDERKFVWVNLDSAKVPEVSWEESFQHVDLQERLGAFDMKRYRYDHSCDQDFEEMGRFFKQVEREDKYLCTHAQRNINAGGYVSGPLHPHNEKGVLHFQSLIKTCLVEHREKEKSLGREIAPAKRSPKSSVTEEEELFCRDVCRSVVSDASW